MHCLGATVKPAKTRCMFRICPWGRGRHDPSIHGWRSQGGCSTADMSDVDLAVCKSLEDKLLAIGKEAPLRTTMGV